MLPCRPPLRPYVRPHFGTRFRPFVVTLLLLAFPFAAGGSGRASPDTPGEGKAAQASTPPVLLDAATLIHNDTAQTVEAEGDATFIYKGQTIRADRLVYDRGTDVVTAEGNVRFWQTSGDVLFARKVILSRDMQQGFVDQLALLMSDNSRFVAAEGERTEGRYVRMNRALYTACEVCKAHPERPPLWQVRADRIIHDSRRKDVIYRNATLEVAGVPVFYTPYLAHPDPSVKRRSGFLAPVLGTRSNLGFVARTYYYLDVTPGMDVTLEASHSEKHGALVGAAWRYRGKRSDVEVSASATQDDIPNDTGGGAVQTQNALRGHLFVDASYRFTPNWRASLRVRRTTDDTYPDLWAFSSDDILTSRAQVEHYTARSRGVAELISFQDLRPGVTDAEPQVTHAGWTAQSAPRALWGGRWSAGTDARAITRSHGLDSTRASLGAGWRREDVLPGGVVVTGDLAARLDGFAAQNLGTAGTDATAARPYAQGQLTARWPLVRMRERGQQFLEPIAQLSLAPRQPRSPSDIANEDSIGLEFDPSNLFTANRYAGVDRLDGGQRVVYGVQGGWTRQDGAGVSALIGQSYDLARQPNYPLNSGLETSRSDIVGSFSALVPGWLDAAYSTRLRSDTYEPREHDLMVTAGPSWLQGSVGYLYAEQPAQGAIAQETRQEMTVGGRWTFRPHWTLSGSHRHDLERSNGALATALNLVYQDECLTFSLIAQRDHVARTGLNSGDSIFFRLIFKNIGEFESPNLSTDVFGNSGL